MPQVPKPKVRKQRKRFAHRRDPAYTDWVRRQPCLLQGRVGLYGLMHLCWGPIQVCHVRSRAAGGDDARNCVAMCAGAHDEQGRGIDTFERNWMVDLKAQAQWLDAAYHAEASP